MHFDRRTFVIRMGSLPLALVGAGVGGERGSTHTPLGEGPKEEVRPRDLGIGADRDLVTLFLCGDVMTGRGIDQVLPHRSDPRLFEPVVRSATEYVKLAEQEHGPIPSPWTTRTSGGMPWRS